jgi:hypothetical protein
MHEVCQINCQPSAPRCVIEVMTRMLSAGLLAALLAATTPVTAGAQQPARVPRELVTRQTPGTPQRVEVAPVIDERNARDIRQRLNEILRDYPPSLGQVLRLDPSLMTREDYLAPYPGLAIFIAQHPEIARDPAFYLGRPSGDNNDQDPTRSLALRTFGEVMGFAFVLCGFVAFFTLVGWLARLIVDHRRWLRATKTQTETHSKLLDRMTSNEDLLAYIQTPAARNFLESAPMSFDPRPRAIGAPVGRILWSVQAGVVLAALGLGLWFVKNSVLSELIAPLRLVAVLAISLGVGFALSAGVAYLLSHRLGLLEPPKP